MSIDRFRPPGQRPRARPRQRSHGVWVHRGAHSPGRWCRGHGTRRLERPRLASGTGRNDARGREVPAGAGDPPSGECRGGGVSASRPPRLGGEREHRRRQRARRPRRRPPPHPDHRAGPAGQQRRTGAGCRRQRGRRGGCEARCHQDRAEHRRHPAERELRGQRRHRESVPRRRGRPYETAPSDPALAPAEVAAAARKFTVSVECWK